MRINQGALNEHVAAQAGIKLQTVEVVLRAFYDVVGRKITEGHTVSVSNFGTWTTRTTAERLAHNPSTMDAVVVPETRHPKFTYSPKVKEAVASGVVPETFRKLGSRR